MFVEVLVDLYQGYFIRKASAMDGFYSVNIQRVMSLPLSRELSVSESTKMTILKQLVL